MLVNSIKIGIVAGAVIATALTVTEPEVQATQEVRIPNSIDQGAPPCLQMYKYIKAYADTFDIPLNYAFGIAYAETRYEGPFQWKYNPAQISCAGAVGPMQIMPATANDVHNQKISKKNLKNNIELNIRTSMKLLHQLHNRYGNWKLVCGYYNTGRPIVNGYASFCVNNKNYRKNWVYIKGI